MSGHLQRLVRSVMQPAETIHPTVGSLFSSSDGPGLPVESGVEAAALTARPELQESQNRADVPEGSELPPQHLIKTERVAVGPQRIASANQLREGTSPEIRSAQSHQAIQPAVTQTFQPLLPSQRARIDQPQAVLGAGPAVPSFKPRGRSQPALPSRQEADEIQIHIGRIEVSAVQQMPPATAVRASRKSPSLDEYLRQRDRRAL